MIWYFPIKLVQPRGISGSCNHFLLFSEFPTYTCIFKWRGKRAIDWFVKIEWQILVQPFWPVKEDLVPEWSWIFRSEGTETYLSIWLPTELSRIFGIIKSTQPFRIVLNNTFAHCFVVLFELIKKQKQKKPCILEWNIWWMTCLRFLAFFANPNYYRSLSLGQDALNLVSSLLLRLTKVGKSLMVQKHSVQWRSMPCHITDNRDLIKEFMVKDQLTLHSTACSCGILFLQVAFWMSLEVLSRYLGTV